MLQKHLGFLTGHHYHSQTFPIRKIAVSAKSQCQCQQFYKARMRFLAEFFREPDRHIGFEAMGWMTRGQLLSLPMVLLGLYLIAMAYRNANGAVPQRKAKGAK